MALDPSASPVSDLLEIVTELEHAFPDFGNDQCVVALIGTQQPSSWDTALLDVPDRSVRDALLGFVAPPDIWALGMVAGGWAAPTDTWDAHEAVRGRTTVRPSAHPDARRVRVITITTRTGITVSRVALAGSDPHELVTDDPADDTGVVADSTRRALGLPTAPPRCDVAELLTSVWLLEVIGLAGEVGGHSVVWETAAAMHPATRLLRDHRSLDPDLVVAAQALSQVLPWSGVLEQCRRGWLPELLRPDLATWMDEGMAARWLLGGVPPVAELGREAARRLHPAVAARLRAAMRQLHPDRSEHRAGRGDSADAA